MAITSIIVVVAILTKLVGCGLGALSLGREDAIRVGAGMVPRGEVGMVVAKIGFGLGVISQAVYGDVVIMAVLTTIAAPPLLSLAFRNVPAVEAVDEFKLG